MGEEVHESKASAFVVEFAEAAPWNAHELIEEMVILLTEAKLITGSGWVTDRGAYHKANGIETHVEMLTRLPGIPPNVKKAAQASEDLENAEAEDDEEMMQNILRGQNQGEFAVETMVKKGWIRIVLRARGEMSAMVKDLSRSSLRRVGMILNDVDPRKFPEIVNVFNAAGQGQTVDAQKILAMGEERDYRKEYDRYHGKKAQRQARSMRNQARREKGLEVGDAREVDHKKPLSKGGTNDSSNLRIVSRETNRSKGDDVAEARALILKEVGSALEQSPWRLTKREFVEVYRHPLEAVNVRQGKLTLLGRKWPRPLTSREREEIFELDGQDSDDLSKVQRDRFRVLRQRDKGRFPLASVLDHSQLYQVFPFLRRSFVFRSSGVWATSDREGNIGLPKTNWGSLVSLYHEITHIVQNNTPGSFHGVNPSRGSEHAASSGEDEAFAAGDMVQGKFSRKKLAEKIHRASVADAVASGVSVPENTLSDYPDLV